MAPILGIIASSITGGLTVDNGAMFPIRSYVVPSGGTASVTFDLTGITTYTHLQIRFIGSVSVGGNITLQFNSDTGSNYKTHSLYGDGASASSFVPSNSGTSISVGYNGASNNFGAGVVDILDAFNTNKYKTTRALQGIDRNGSGDISFNSGVWMSTSAVTSVKLTPQSSGSWNQYSSFAIYGVKA
jgi:hypothetical protein